MSTHAQRIIDLEAHRDRRGDLDREQQHRVSDFATFGRCLMVAAKQSRGAAHFTAVEVAKECRASPRVIAALEEKAAVPSGSTTSWGAPLVVFNQLSGAFLASLRNDGVLDAALPFMKQIPLHGQIAVTTLGATAASIGQGQSKIISKLALANSQLQEIKAVGIVVLSDDLLKMAGPLANQLFAQELSVATAVESDRSFLAEVTSGVTPISSAGTSADAILTDIENALGAISFNAQSRVFIAVDPGTCKLWALRLNAAGNFSDLTISGGDLMGATVVPTDGLANQIVAFDATQIAANGGNIDLDASNQAAIQMDSAPDSPPTASTTLVSLWQMNMTGLRASRWFGAEPRSGAVSVISGVADSPI